MISKEEASNKLKQFREEYYILCEKYPQIEIHISDMGFWADYVDMDELNNKIVVEYLEI